MKGVKTEAPICKFGKRRVLLSLVTEIDPHLNRPIRHAAVDKLKVVWGVLPLLHNSPQGYSLNCRLCARQPEVAAV